MQSLYYIFYVLAPIYKKEISMAVNDLTLRPVGYVSSPFKKHGDAPRQGKMTDELSVITISPEYADAADGLCAGDDIFIFCWFDRADRTVLKSRMCEFESNPLTGVFTHRTPNRPNPISLTLVKLVNVEGSVLTVRGLEAYDGTPVLDIKPYYAHLESPRKD